MKALAWIAFYFFCIIAENSAQTPISGVINQYTAVQGIDDSGCLARLDVTDTTGFSVGMAVILIQIKGATIDESNSATFGSASLGGAGLYEKNQVDSLANGQVFLKREILHNYDISGKVQLVTMPSFEDALITSKLTAKPWNGETGGILAFSVTNELTMNAIIDVSGKGFRGGIAQTNLPNDCNWFSSQNDYFYNSSSWRGAAKGEGVAEFISGKEAGKGPQANGGGGGNDHNSGGGGGANVTFGAEGGENNEPSTFGCKGQHPGLGGKALPQLNERFYLGGGGGAGHGNNNVATNGGNGGGILFMEVNTITTNGFQILAHGESVADGGGDGGGGGGAGGTLILFVTQANGQLLLEAIGGDGGNIDNNNANRCHGPGGGGSGGVVAGDFPNSWIEPVGGLAGLSSNSADCSDSNNGASDGQSGVEVGIAQLNQGVEVITEINFLSQPVSQEACPGDTLFYTTEINGTANYQWQVDQGSGFIDVIEGLLFNGTTSNALQINGSMTNMSGWVYRCVVSNACDEEISEEALLEVFPELIVNSGNQTVVFCEGDSEIFSFSASGEGLQFQWQLDTGSGFNDLTDNLTYSGTNTQFLEISNATIGMDGYTYQIIVTDTCDQEIESGSILLIVEGAPSADFSFSINGNTVSFTNESNDGDSYLWNFGDNSNPSDLTDPEHSYTQNGIYSVQLIVMNNCGSDTLEQEIIIDSESFPEVAFSSDAVEGCAPTIVQFTDQSTSNIQSWEWTFPGGDPASSTEANPIVTYWNPGSYEVTLEVENSAGSTANTIDNYITILPSLFASFTFTVDENEVDFNNTSQNSSNYQWDFGDGSDFSAEENPSHVYDQPGVYLVTLVVTNSACGGAITIPVEVLFTSTINYEEENWIHVYPNPVQDVLYLEFLQQADFKSLKLYNALGRCILKENLSFEKVYQADLSKMAKGVYFLEARIMDQVFVKKLLKL